MMKFELLPNEILLDIFDYLPGATLLHGFDNLNSRLNYLLYNHFRFYRFDFSCLSKHQFDMICQQYLPFILDRILLLHLSEFDKTPGQINLFFSYIPSISPFTHLRTLELYNLRSYPILMKIIDELHYLRNLTRLNVQFRCSENYEIDLQLIIDNIWSLPKLIVCHFIVYTRRELIFCLPTKVSTCIQDVDISMIYLKWNDLYRLLEYTPRLKYLHNRITFCDNDDYKPCLIPTLIDLNISVYEMLDVSKMFLFLQNTPNLRRLDVDSLKLINGYQWKQTIRNYLPKLKIFKLKMCELLFGNQNIEEQVNELINSFQSSFWTVERRWFVRCFTYNKTIHLETLSEIYLHFEKNLPDLWKSTYPEDNKQKFYNDFQAIFLNEFFEQPVPSHIQLPNLYLLSIKLPIDEKFWSIIPSLDKLRILILSIDTDTDQSQLQNLLDRLSHLRELRIRQDSSLPLPMSLFKLTSSSICELYLQKSNHRFNEKESLTLSHSPLGIQCKILSIKVKNRQSIIILVQNMTKLQALYIHCEDDQYSKHLSSTQNANISTTDHLIQWLKDNLSSTYFISRYSDSCNCIQIWIQ